MSAADDPRWQDDPSPSMDDYGLEWVGAMVPGDRLPTDADIALYWPAPRSPTGRSRSDGGLPIGDP